MNKTPVPCRCGRNPEVNMNLRGYQHSLSCKCGTDEINFVTWSDDQQKLFDNWESLIKRTPYKHSVQHLPSPDAEIQTPVSSLVGSEHFDSDPLRRYVRATGGHCSGHGDCC